jgi:RNA polymerase sigma-70 factor (ECF subfamily)
VNVSLHNRDGSSGAAGEGEAGKEVIIDQKDSKQDFKPACFDQLYSRWNQPLYRYLVHLIGNTALAEDLYQDTWVNAIERIDQLRTQDCFGPWIFRIARNLAFNQMRKSRRRGQVWILSNLKIEKDVEEAEDLVFREPDRKPGPQNLAIQGQQREILQEAIDQLDLQSQEMLQLRYFEQMTLAEVAEILNVPIGTVCTKVHRSLRKIRVHLEQKGYRMKNLALSGNKS